MKAQEIVVHVICASLNKSSYCIAIYKVGVPILDMPSDMSQNTRICMQAWSGMGCDHTRTPPHTP